MFYICFTSTIFFKLAHSIIRELESTFPSKTLIIFFSSSVRGTNRKLLFRNVQICFSLEIKNNVITRTSLMRCLLEGLMLMNLFKTFQRAGLLYLNFFCVFDLAFSSTWKERNFILMKTIYINHTGSSIIPLTLRWQKRWNKNCSGDNLGVFELLCTLKFWTLLKNSELALMKSLIWPKTVIYFFVLHHFWTKIDSIIFHPHFNENGEPND